MPGFDGKGPLGQGPMTGRGQGFCVLKTSEDDPQQVKGFTGIVGKPVGNMIERFRHLGKEVTDMPFGDGTGPAGLGTMTGRAAGFCVGFPVPGYMTPVAGRTGFYGPGVPTFRSYSPGLYGYRAPYAVPYAGQASLWLRRGFGFGRGFGRGRGWGRGRGRFGYW